MTPPEEKPASAAAAELGIAMPNRHDRRAMGFRQPVYTQNSPALPRYVRRNGEVMLGTATTRRQRKARARCLRVARKRGLQ